MPVSIVSNVASNITRGNLVRHNTDVTTASTRLSSGQRVFSAEQDASALSIGTSLKIDIAGLRSALINASNGSSTLQIADGALSEISEIVVRMKSLANQSSSGQVDDAARALIDREFQILKAEIDRIAADTEFSGTPLLAGDALFNLDYGHIIQNDGVTAPVLDSAVISADSAFRYTYDSTTETLTMSRTEGGVPQVQSVDVTALLDSVAGVGQNLANNETVDVFFSGVGARITLDANFDRTQDITPALTDNSGADIALTLSTPEASFTNSNVTLEAVQALSALDASTPNYSSLTGILNVQVTTDGSVVNFGGQAGIRYGINGGAAGADGAPTADLVSGTPQTVEVYITTANGVEQLGQVNLASVATSGTTDGVLSFNVGQGVFGADYNTTGGSRTLTFVVGNGVNPTEDLVQVTLPTTNSDQLGFGLDTVLTQASASTTSANLSQALATLVSLRANVGSSQVRLDAAARNIQVSIENNEGARSNILDVDFAAETTNLAEAQAMLEVSVNLLSRVNQQPQILLDLIRNS